MEVDSVSPVHWLYVSWSGRIPISITSVQTVGTDARAYIVTHVPSKSIAPGGVDSIGVEFAPDLEGVPQAELVVNTTYWVSSSDTLPLFGTGILPHLSTAAENPLNEVSNTSHNLVVTFDSVRLGTDTCMNITLTNSGSDTTAIMQYFFSSHDPDFTIQPIANTLIPPGGSQTLEVCFSPVQRGYRTATVEIKTNIPHTQTAPPQDTSTFFVQFIGTGAGNSGVGHLVITGTPAYDTVSVGDTVCFVDTLWNIGTAPILVNNITAWTGGLPLVFWASEYPPEPFVLAPNTYKTVLICAEPTTLGPTTGLLSATDTGAGLDTEQYALFELTITISQIGDRVSLAKPFDIGACTGDSNIATVNVFNSGSIAGGMPDTYTASITGANASDFTIESQNPSPVVTSGNSADFFIRFIPSTDSLETALLWIKRSSDGKSSGPYTLSASGGGTATITGDTTILALPKQRILFSVPIHNTGTCTWTSGIPTIAQTDSAFACLGNGSVPIAANSTGYLVFTFTPPSAGEYTATLSFPNESSPSTPAANVQITGIAESDAIQTISSAGGYSLGANYPNPARGMTDVAITLPEPGIVQLSILDESGKTVEQMLKGQFNAGTYNVTLDVAILPSGTYYYQMSAGGVMLTREMTVIK